MAYCTLCNIYPLLCYKFGYGKTPTLRPECLFNVVIKLTRMPIREDPGDMSDRRRRRIVLNSANEKSAFKMYDRSFSKSKVSESEMYGVHGGFLIVCNRNNISVNKTLKKPGEQKSENITSVAANWVTIR